MTRLSIRRLSPSKLCERSLHVAATAMFCSIFGCSAPLGGWDLEPLLAAEPQLAELDGHRLGDLIPFPIPTEGRVALVSCRWPSQEPIRVKCYQSCLTRRTADDADKSVHGSRFHPIGTRPCLPRHPKIRNIRYGTHNRHNPRRSNNPTNRIVRYSEPAPTEMGG